jgi:hypothetical protein
MKGKYPIIIFVASILFTSTVLSKQGTAANIAVNQTADKITITGGKGKKIASDKFTLSKDGWYIIKILYTGADISVCQLSLVTQTMITAKQTVGGLLTNWIGPNTVEIIQHKGAVKSEDYMIYVDDAGGPWTVEIFKSPKPTPVSSNTAFSGTTNKVTPYFHLKKGSAKFMMHQKLKGRFSPRLEVELINADTGTFVRYLCHNTIEPTQTAAADIPADGNFILEVSGGDNWDVSYSQ